MALWLLLSGCSQESSGVSALEGGQIGDEAPPCEPEPAVEVAPDELTPAGLSAHDIVALVTAAPVATMTYADGGMADVTFGAELEPPARYSDGCGILYAPTRLSVATSDSAWALDATVLLVAAGPSVASGVFVGPPGEIGLDLARFAVGTHESYEARISFAFATVKAFGNLAVFGQDSDRSETKYPIGSF
jgi:hypothetical protein